MIAVKKSKKLFTSQRRKHKHTSSVLEGRTDRHSGLLFLPEAIEKNVNTEFPAQPHREPDLNIRSSIKNCGEPDVWCYSIFPFDTGAARDSVI